MPRVAFAALTALLLVAAAAAAPRPARTTASRTAESHSTRTTESHTFDEPTTETKRFELLVPSGGAAARFRFRGSIRSGEIRARLIDPSGEVRRNVWLAPEKSKPNSFEFEGGEMKAAGAWTLEVELKGATGHYEFTWSVD